MTDEQNEQDNRACVQAMFLWMVATLGICGVIGVSVWITKSAWPLLALMLMPLARIRGGVNREAKKED